MVYLDAPAGMTEPPVDPAVWAASQHTWLGWDGSEWDLSHGLSGLALQAGTRGMFMPPVIRYPRKAPGVDGSRSGATATDEREAMWPIKVFSGGGSQEWIEHNRRFWRTLNPDRSGLWVITQPSGEKRSLRVRYTGMVDDSADYDPGMFGWFTYGIQLVAEDPFWLGETLTRTFKKAGEGTNYYGAGGYGPPFYITSGSTTDNATMTNEGDKSAWPIWTIRGPSTTVTVGLNGHEITFPMTLTSGQFIRLDTAPTNQVAIDHNGNDRTAQLGAVDFARIPSGANVPLTITMVGTGSVDVSITPRFYQAK